MANTSVLRTGQKIYDPTNDIWPDLRLGRIVNRPVRVGVNDKTGKVLIGWDHVVQSIAKIFVTRYHTRVLRRWVGCFLPHILGKSATRYTIPRFYGAIISAIELNEPNYRIQRVRIQMRSNGLSLTSAEDLRKGTLETLNEGVYRPRAHMGDDTPEVRRAFGLVGKGYGPWQAANIAE